MMESEFSRGTFLRWSTPFLQWNSRLCRDTKSSRRFWGLHNAQGSNGFLEKVCILFNGSLNRAILFTRLTGNSRYRPLGPGKFNWISS